MEGELKAKLERFNLPVKVGGTSTASSPSGLISNGGGPVDLISGAVDVVILVSVRILEDFSQLKVN